MHKFLLARDEQMMNIPRIPMWFEASNPPQMQEHTSCPKWAIEKATNPTPRSDKANIQPAIKPVREHLECCYQSGVVTNKKTAHITNIDCV